MERRYKPYYVPPEDDERWKALEEIYRKRIDDTRKYKRDEPQRRDYSSDTGNVSTLLGLLGSAEPVGYGSEQPIDWGAIRGLGAGLGLDSMSPAALEALAAFSGLGNGLGRFLSQPSEDEENWAPRITRETRTVPTPEDWGYRITKETRTIPKPDADTDAVIREVLSRYLRGGER